MLTPDPTSTVSADALLAALRAAGEPTRLRILALLAEGELTVKDLTTILGQSQPRISRHLKLLAEAGLVDRHPEGAWVYWRLTDSESVRRLVDSFVSIVDRDDPALLRDREWLAAVRRAHAENAARYFQEHAEEWDTIRSLHVPESAVETAMKDVLGNRPVDGFLDLGTGTGRLLELFAPLYARGVGIDTSTAMLAVARANLARAGVAHAQIRHGDINAIALPRDSFDVVVIHQVLHYLDDPARAIREAARVLRPGGRLLIVDFAPHALEFLRDRHAHRRLGFSHEAMTAWLEGAGLTVDKAVDLAGTGGEGKLTVTLWLARDPRLVIAGASERVRETA